MDLDQSFHNTDQVIKYQSIKRSDEQNAKILLSTNWNIAGKPAIACDLFAHHYGQLFHLHGFIAKVSKLFTQRAKFGKTVEAAGRTLIGKQGEDLLFFFGYHSPRANVICKIKGFRLVFHFNFAPLRLILLKMTAIRDL